MHDFFALLKNSWQFSSGYKVAKWCHVHMRKVIELMYTRKMWQF